MSLSKEDADKVLKFWFSVTDLEQLKSDTFVHSPRLWFELKHDTDLQVRAQFSSLLELVEKNETDSETLDRQQLMALVILLGQMSYFIHRGTAKMYANGARAIHYATQLLTINNNSKELSLIEEYFCLLTWLQAEDAALSKRGLDGIEQLAKRAPDSQRTSFVKYFQAAYALHQIVAKYGRFPFRNELLERTSTLDEIDFLIKNKSKYYKVIGKHPQAKQPTIKKKDSAQLQEEERPRLQKVLYLHGFRQHSHKIKQRLRRLTVRLKAECNAHVYFLNGTHPYIPEYTKHEETADQDPKLQQQRRKKSTASNGSTPPEVTEFGAEVKNADEDPFLNRHITINPIESQRIWYSANHDSSIYYGIDESIAHVLTHIKANGPYDGLIGFSQGAVLGTILIHKYPQLFRWFIAISGHAPRADRFRTSLDSSPIEHVPSLHIYGKHDALVSWQKSAQLASHCFRNAIVCEHSAGHFAPDAWPHDRIAQFISAQAAHIKPPIFDKTAEASFRDRLIWLNANTVRFHVQELDLVRLLSTESARALFASSAYQRFFAQPTQDLYSELKDDYLKCSSAEDKLLLFYFVLLRHKHDDHQEDQLRIILSMWIDLGLDDFETLFANAQHWRELVLLCDMFFDRDEAKYVMLLDRFAEQLIVDFDTLEKKLSFKEREEHCEMRKLIGNEALIDQVLRKKQQSMQLVLADDQMIDQDPESSLVLLSDLSVHIPRVKTALDKHSRIGREVAIRLNPLADK